MARTQVYQRAANLEDVVHQDAGCYVDLDRTIVRVLRQDRARVVQGSEFVRPMSNVVLSQVRSD